ncbi:MAG: L-histidine N(alpha)-methyltransferase [Gammaproteobacteria bacterium]
MTIKLFDCNQENGNNLTEILHGLRQKQKTIAPKFFYDRRGSRLFEAICRQPEYYPTRTEFGIMKSNIAGITRAIGSGVAVIEFGSGDGVKTRVLLDSLREPAAYIPVDISRDALLDSAARIDAAYPHIEVIPVCADFSSHFELPNPRRAPTRNIVFFPGSTIGNFSHDDAVDLMRIMRREAGDNGSLLIGVDLVKSRKIIEPAYNDAAGITAKFNLNLLSRMNRDHGGDFHVDHFEHKAIYDEDENRIEMRLISRRKQTVRLAGKHIPFEEGEFIVTEHSHKYTQEGFEAMAKQAGFTKTEHWSDRDSLFSVQLLNAC